MSMQAINPARSWPAGFGLIVIGIVVGILVVVALTLVRPVVFAFGLGGLLLLTPTLLMREPKAYWLFLLVSTIPFDIGKRTTTWPRLDERSWPAAL